MRNVFGHTRVCWLELTSLFLGQTNGHFSMYLILAIATQRFLKIKYGMKRLFIATKSGSWTLAVTCFVWSVCHGLVSTYFFDQLKSRVPNIIMMVIRSVIVLTIYICYFLLYRSVSQQVKVTAKWNKSSDTVQGLSKSRNSVPTFFKTVFLILIGLAACYIPLLIMDLWTGFYTLIEDKAAPQWPRFLYYLMHAPFFVNSSLNAAIYVYRNKDCKDYLKGLLLRKGKDHEEASPVTKTSQIYK